MARIEILDLPENQEPTPEDLERIFGAGRRNRVQLRIESLEGRELPIEGTEAADRLRLPRVTDSLPGEGVVITTNREALPHVSAEAPPAIEVNALGGDDVIDLVALSLTGAQALGKPISLPDANSEPESPPDLPGPLLY